MSEGPQPKEASSIEVDVLGVYTSSNGVRQPLSVSASCASQYDGGQAAVPLSARGTERCRYIVARGPVEIEYAGRVLGRDGEVLRSFDGPISVRVIPGDFADAIGWSSASAGDIHATGIRTDGSLWTWGSNEFSQLADMSRASQTTPQAVTPSTRWRMVSAGGTFTAALRSDGHVMAFGTLSGQLSQTADFVAIEAGRSHLLALRQDGTLWAAGNNAFGQLGEGSTTTRSVLVPVQGGQNIVDFSAGDRHSLAVQANGTLWAFGSNDRGQLGLAVATTSTPMQVGSETVWKSVAAGGRHSLATRVDLSLWAFGANDQGQLGLGTLTSVSTPTRVGTSVGWQNIAAGATHSLGIRQPGTVAAWGSNDNGELGDGTTTTRTTPQPVGSATDWSGISAGNAFSIATKVDGTVFSWGMNSFGQLGVPPTPETAIRTLPERLRTSGYENRWRYASQGEVLGVVRSIHQYGQVRLWLEHAPPRETFDGGAVAEADRLPPVDTLYSYATGTSKVVWFEEQTLQSLNTPDGLDNRGSPFVGEFVRIGTPPEMGTPLRQTCLDDPDRNGQPMAMVVTGVEPTGFYVSDITACRVKEVLQAGTIRLRTPEPPEPCLVTLPDGGTDEIERAPAIPSGRCAISKTSCTARTGCASYSPGTFGSIFVFNFSFPDGLNQGDLLFSLSGSVQEFTSTTQLTFPSWTIAERVRTLPPSQWEKWLQFVPPVELNARLCGQDNLAQPFITDPLCGQSTTNLKLESLESSLVRLRGVRFPERFVNCDFDANGSVPFYCNRTDTINGATVRSWGNCDFDTPPAPEVDNERRERECTQNCTLGRGEMGNTVCSEESTFIGFGQFSAEMAPPGPRWANLDDSSPNKIQSVSVSSPSPMARISGLLVPETSGFDPGTFIAATCDVPVRWKAGDETVVATDADPRLEARRVLNIRLPPGQDSIAFRPTDASGRCYAAINPRTRINLLTRDAIPELNPNCRVDDGDAEVARQCRLMRAATYDIVGHLKQVQPARPRWNVIPRDPDDVCCYPGEGLECPRPLRACQGS
jgi:alpha-tubulin suppressor-like RCC1 family protein